MSNIPCDDAISRQATLEPCQTLNDNDVISVGMIRKNIKETLTFISLKKIGKWIEVDTNMYSHSNCNHCFTIIPEDNHISQFKFCPNCVEKIQGVKNMTNVKKPFKFTYTKPSLDWYEEMNVSITYDDYNYLTLERRYGGSWWVIGKKYIEDKDKWISEQIGEIWEKDIPRLVEWAEYTNCYGRQVSILNEVRAIDGCLNPIREFFRIMNKYQVESEA